MNAETMLDAVVGLMEGEQREPQKFYCPISLKCPARAIFTKTGIMLERTQTINGVEYSYHYGGNGTIAVTAPVQVVIDLKQMPKLSVTPLGDISDAQRAHFDGALQAIVADMFAQIPGR